MNMDSVIVGWLDLFTLAFDSSPIKGEGEDGWFIFLPIHCPSTSGLRIKSAMTVLWGISGR